MSAGYSPRWRWWVACIALDLWFRFGWRWALDLWGRCIRREWLGYSRDEEA